MTVTHSRRKRFLADSSRASALRDPRAVVGAIVLASALTLTGCGAADDPAVGAAPTPTEPERVAVTDKETCAGIGDIAAITFNTDMAVFQGRMTTEEQQNWYRMATRVLDRVPTSGAGSVSEAVTNLQTEFPPIAPGGMGATAIGTDKWDTAYSAVYDSCEKAGFTIETWGFTGG
jgi:hypothetical protein